MPDDRYFTEITEALITILRVAEGNRQVLEQVLALAYTCGIAAVEREEAKAARFKVYDRVRADLDRGMADMWRGIAE